MGAETNMLLAGFRLMQSGDFAGTITYAGKDYPAAIGAFSVQQVLNPDGGGFSNTVLGIATVAREDMPPGTTFRRGELVIATPIDSTRPQRACRVYDMRDCGPLIELTLNDKNEAA